MSDNKINNQQDTHTGNLKMLNEKLLEAETIGNQLITNLTKLDDQVSFSLNYEVLQQKINFQCRLQYKFEYEKEISTLKERILNLQTELKLAKSDHSISMKKLNEDQERLKKTYEDMIKNKDLEIENLNSLLLKQSEMNISLISINENSEMGSSQIQDQIPLKKKSSDLGNNISENQFQKYLEQPYLQEIISKVEECEKNSRVPGLDVTKMIHKLKEKVSQIVQEQNKNTPKIKQAFQNSINDAVSEASLAYLKQIEQLNQQCRVFESEISQLKNLAKSILQQRSDVEEFFIEALYQVQGGQSPHFMNVRLRDIPKEKTEKILVEMIAKVKEGNLLVKQ